MSRVRKTKRACAPRLRMGFALSRAMAVLLAYGLTTPLFAQEQMRGELTHDFVGAYQDFIQRENRRGPVLDLRDSSNIEQAWSLRPAPNGLRESADAAPLAAGDPRLGAALYRRAFSYYERAVEELRDFRAELAAVGVLRETVRDPLWWRWIESVERANRQEVRLRADYGQRLTGYFRETFRTLDRIGDVELAKSDSALDLRKRSYRLYAVNQVALGNFSAALAVLERLQALPGMDGEWPLYYYLGVCYRAEFRVARGNTGVREATLLELRRRSNLYRMRAVELKYGRASVEFRQLFDAVRLEELGGPRTEATLEYPGVE